jgi:hypothetical protein
MCRDIDVLGLRRDPGQRRRLPSSRSTYLVRNRRRLWHSATSRRTASATHLRQETET